MYTDFGKHMFNNLNINTKSFKVESGANTMIEMLKILERSQKIIIPISFCYCITL